MKQNLVFLLSNQFYGFLAENSQKATLNVFFKTRFSVEPGKFPLYFTRDCSFVIQN